MSVSQPLAGFMENAAVTRSATEMPRESNPRNLSDAAVKILIEEDHCPMCLGELDTGWECNECNYDAMPIGKQLGVIRI